MAKQLFFSEHVEFLKEKKVWGQSYKDLRILFNDRFGTFVTARQIMHVCSYRRLVLGRPAEDEYLPVGTERIARNGYVMMKTAASEEWRYKHHVIWESAHGPIPDGHVLIFGDRNRYNFAIDNLILVSRSEFYVMKGKKLIQNHTELTRTGLLIARLYLAMRKRFLEDPALGPKRYYAWLRERRKNR